MLRKAMVFPILLLTLLLSACTAGAQPAPSQPPTSSSSPTPSELPSPSPSYEIVGGIKIKTDYSQLTPYAPPADTWTRLSDGPMPALVPSEDYGPLLPYAGRSYVNPEGWMTFYDYGLATKDGTLVTDPVYSGVSQASHYDADSGKTMYEPFYILEVPPKNAASIQNRFGARALHALCALDGSFITKFEYADIQCYDKVMLLIRDLQKNDADVMDYTGKLLYNTKDLPCYQSLPEYAFHDNDFEIGDYGNGLYQMNRQKDKPVILFFDELTGKLTETSYETASYFSGGLAAVCKDGLWGYIDTSFQVVIPLQYANASPFTNGRAMVVLKNGDNAVIDRSGNVLLRGELCANPIGAYYMTGDRDGTYHFFDSSLRELYSTKDFDSWTNCGSGGILLLKDRSGLLLCGGKEYRLQDVAEITSINSLYMTCRRFTGGYDLMTLDGRVLAPVTASAMLSTAIADPGNCIIVDDYGGADPAYKITAPDGTVLLSGRGYARYEDQYGLIEIRDQRFFAYADASGSIVFRFSLLDDVPD